MKSKRKSPAPKTKEPKKTAAKPEAKKKPAGRRTRPTAPLESKMAGPAGARERAFAPAKMNKPRRALPGPIPPELLEGDEPVLVGPAGPGRRFVLEPESRPQKPVIPSPADRLPEAYGSGKLFLTARDPHTVYAGWDLTREQLERWESLAGGGETGLASFCRFRTAGDRA